MRSLSRIGLVAAALSLATSLGGCSSRNKPATGGMDGAAGTTGMTTSDAGDDGATSGAACLDSPSDLPRPPGAALPCELIPPGLRL